MHEVTPVLQEGSPLQATGVSVKRTLRVGGACPQGLRRQAYPFAVRRGISHRGFPT